MRLAAPVTNPHRPRSSMAREDSETPEGTLCARAEQRAERGERRGGRPVEPGRTTDGRVRLVEARKMNDTGDRPRALEDADAHAPGGEPGHEGGRAVDGVEDDTVGPPALTRRALLAEDAGVGE